MLPKFFKKQSGMGLVEVMVAASILGGLSLVVMKLNETGIQGVTRTEKGMEIVEFDSEINSYLASKEGCTNSVAGTPLLTSFDSTGEQYAIPSVRDRSNVVKFTPGVAGDVRRNVRFRSAYLTAYDVPTPAGPGAGNAFLVKTYEFKLSPEKTITKSKQITVAITPDTATGTMLSECIIKATKSDSVWTVDTYGIYYNNLTVAIGKSAAVSVPLKLDVEGQVMTGFSNTITGATPAFHQINGGAQNRILGTAATYSSIFGGRTNSITSGTNGVIVGGISNLLDGNSALNSVIAGGSGNQIYGGAVAGWNGYGTILGGLNNRMYDVYWSTVVGGQLNSVTGASNSVVGGIFNYVATGSYNSIMGGNGNIIEGAGLMDYSSIVGGYSNKVSTWSGLILGGNNNSVGEAIGAIINARDSSIRAGTGGHNIVLSGWNNTAGGSYASVLNGNNNHANGGSSTISGGYMNTVTGNTAGIYSSFFSITDAYASTILSGESNRIVGNWTNTGSTILGGSTNTAVNSYSSVLGGSNNYSAGIGSSIIASNSSLIIGGSTSSNSAVIGGFRNTINSGYASVISASYDSTLSSTNTSAIIGGRSHRIEGAYNVIMGGWGHSVGGSGNYASGVFSGEGNLINGTANVIVGGTGNENHGGGWRNSIFGGVQNTISGVMANNVLIGGGYNKMTTGDFSAILGGTNNTVSAWYGITIGGRAMGALHNGVVIIGDYTSGATPIVSTGVDQFISRFAGGYSMCTNAGCTTGAQMAGGVNGFSNISSRAKKEDFEFVDKEKLLESISMLDIPTWMYKEKDAKKKRYIGPMAEDFYKYILKPFNITGDDQTINQLDLIGVTLAGLQGVEKRTENLQIENKKLQNRIDQLEKEMDQLSSQMNEVLKESKK